jgi:hypothetical protein
MQSEALLLYIVQHPLRAATAIRPSTMVQVVTWMSGRDTALRCCRKASMHTDLQGGKVHGFNLGVPAVPFYVYDQ